jgi:hypothetical protein
MHLYLRNQQFALEIENPPSKTAHVRGAEGLIEKAKQAIVETRLPPSQPQRACQAYPPFPSKTEFRIGISSCEDHEQK